MPIAVLVADYQRLDGEALTRALNQFPDLKVTDAQSQGGLDAVTSIVANRPDVALLNYWMPDIDAAAAVRLISAWSSNQKVIFLSWFHSQSHINQVLEAGAVGFLPRSLSVAEVAAAIRRAHQGESPVFAEQTGRFSDRLRKRHDDQKERWRRLSSLTPREVQILRLLSEGRPGKQLARTLSITPGTLQIHIHNILKKTDSQTQLEAISMARHEGLIRP